MREELEARPSALFFVALVLGLVSSAALIACGFGLGLAIWVRELPRKWIVAIGFLVGIALSPSPPARISDHLAVNGMCTVISVPTLSEDHQVCEIRVGSADVLATLPSSPPLMIWDRFEVYGDVKPVGATRPPFDPMIGAIQIRRVEGLVKGPWIAQLADGWRRSFLDFLSRTLPPDEASLTDAICFNGRSLLDAGTREDLKASGLVHLVSVSGIQVFALASLVFLGLRLFPIPRWARILILSCVLGMYAFGAGLQPQIVRAVAMVILGMASYIFSRDPDPLSALCLCGTGVLLWRPDTVFGIGFQLSFVVAVGFSLFFRTKFELRSGWKELASKRIEEFWKASAIVVFAAYPLVAYGMGLVSIGGLISNLLVFWSVPLIVGAAFFSHGLSLLLPAIGEGAASTVLSPLCQWVQGCAHLTASPFASVSVPGFSGYWLVIYYGAWALMYRRRIVHP